MLKDTEGPILAVPGSGDQFHVRIGFGCRSEFLRYESRLPHADVTAWADIQKTVANLETMAAFLKNTFVF